VAVVVDQAIRGVILTDSYSLWFLASGRDWFVDGTVGAVVGLENGAVSFSGSACCFLCSSMSG